VSSAHVQELRGHYVRRLPTATEMSARSPIVLTERDRQLLVAVHRHGFMTLRVGFDVLVQTEKVGRIVGILKRHEPLIAFAIG
jgi:hypothetical protein